MKAVIGVFLHPDIPIGDLVYQADRGRETCQFAYAGSWLSRADRFAIDPELPLGRGYVFPRAGQNLFFGCFVDCEPDGWGRKVIARDRQKRGLPPANSLDFLLDVHDSSRVGALRFSRDGGATFLADPGPGKRAAPPFIELKDLLRAATAVDEDTETAADLRMLLERGSPLGGMRPKCTILEEDGSLAIGKFPAATDKHDVVRGEILALTLAGMAGIEVAKGRVVIADKRPVAVIRRFDRVGERRIAYQSARTFIDASNSKDEHAYVELVDALRSNGAATANDIEELWRRIVFTILISNFDDHLNNHGFLHAARGQWRLAPAFDLNPAAEKARDLKTWISLDTGPAATIEAAMHATRPFGIAAARARGIISDVEKAVAQWKTVATGLGMKAADIKALSAAFEHEERKAAARAMAERPLPSPPPRRRR